MSDPAAIVGANRTVKASSRMCQAITQPVERVRDDKIKSLPFPEYPSTPPSDNLFTTTVLRTSVIAIV
jgi:hypothetical protein